MNKSGEKFDNLVSGKIDLKNIENSTTSKEVVDEFKKINEYSKDRELFKKDDL